MLNDTNIRDIDDRFIQIPNKIRRMTFKIDGVDRHLTPNEYVVFSEILDSIKASILTHDFMDKDGRHFCVLGYEQIGRMVNLSKNTVKKAMGILVGVGLICIGSQYDYGKANKIYVNTGIR